MYGDSQYGSMNYSFGPQPPVDATNVVGETLGCGETATTGATLGCSENATTGAALGCSEAATTGEVL